MFVNLDRVMERISEGQRFLVIGHINPDGDDISSVASLVMILRKAGKIAEGCIDADQSGFLQRLAGSDLIKNVDGLRDYAYDTSITVDSSDLARIGKAVELLDDGTPDITLDHHKSNLGFGRLNFCDAAYAATAMIVYEIGERLVDFDQNLAEMLLLGIATDTGFFRYSSVDERVFRYAGTLVRNGARVGKVAEAVLEHRTMNEIHLLSDMFTTIKLSPNGKLVSAYVTAEMMERAGCTDEDTAGLIGQIRSIAGVEVAIMFIEWPQGTVHVSLRSKEHIDVSLIALNHGGGGHARAAGCSMSGIALDELMKDIIAETEQAIEAAFPE